MKKRTILNGTVNGLAFSLKENGDVLCRESKFGRLIRKWVSAIIMRDEQKLKEGLNPVVVMDIADELEKRQDINIQVNKVIRYIGETTLVYYLHVPREKKCSPMPFLKGRFEFGGTFRVNVNLSTKALDPKGNLDQNLSDIIKSDLESIAEHCISPSIPNRNVAIFKALKAEMPFMIVEQAYFYLRPIDPNVVY